jgi:hypothetical protein
MHKRVAAVGIAVVLACSKSSNGKSDAASSGRGADSSSASNAVGVAPGPECPANGLWAQCSVLYRLDRAGLAPRLDSTETVEEKTIGASGAAHTFVLKIGKFARLEVFVYPDSAARIADETKLNRTQFVGPAAQQTIKRERTLMENANFIGLLTSINAHQRERVSDALMAGPPQRNTKQ